MTNILFCGLKYEYGRMGTSLSFEYQNFYRSLEQMPGVRASFFATDKGLFDESERELVNQQLIKTVQEQKPDILFCFLFTDELKPQTIKTITEQTSTKTFNWFADDHWRLPNFSRYWAPLFTLVGTTDSQAPAEYKRYGITNVIKTQWAANPTIFKPTDMGQKQLGISFVGKNYGKRGMYVQKLQSEGLPAQGYGKGFSGGVVSDEKMKQIFSSSKINLNFAESFFDWKTELIKLFIKKRFGKYELNFHVVDNARSLLGKFRKQIKGRTFEVPACGGFLMTGLADNLEDYYIDGKEIVVFHSEQELVEKSKYYLAHDSERAEIAQAGYERTLRDHTYEKRFKEIFSKLL